MIAETIYTDKALDIIALACRPDTRQLTFEGTIRSSKTVTAIDAFFWAVYFSDMDTHLVASLDKDTLNNNVLNANGFGLLTKFNQYCSDFKKDEIGAYYIEINAPSGFKKVILCSYANKSKWKNILGMTIDKMLIDECNTADPQFINECYARQTSCDSPLTIYTLNGDVPTHSVYEHINCSRILGKCPASIRVEMSKVPKKAGYYYIHWTMQDNPVMTPEKIAKAYELYPVGSYYHTIKILGERGTPGKLIYVDYIDEAKLLQKVDTDKLHSFIIGVDVGATKALNSITLTGFTAGYTSTAIVDKISFLQCGYKEKTEKLRAFLKKCNNLKISNIEHIYVDNAEQNYITDLAAEFKREGLPPVSPCYKATIKDRIDLVILLMSSGKFIVNDTAAGREVLNALKQATWEEGKEGEKRKDENEPWNDILDSLEYTLTRRMNALLKSAKGS